MGLAVDPLIWTDAQEPLLGRGIARFESLLQRVDREEIEAMIQESRSPEQNPA